MNIDAESMTFEILGIVDDSDCSELRSERLEKLIAKIILLGRTRGRPRKEVMYEEEQSAA